ncbi:hypothetical protein IED13_27195 [Bosea sp. SSUT16]|uniref:Uncharacterized protein n=1 Tax=Bosea spartocytisi TaxID=2773451 RepID=A0A927I350_9HYPH|nr:hypothetical protein [Bosea spartocytisi]MBD3849402.1 hypothetical protein [Bosea spartocytisi]MCT4475007.1 hypothetical protein [Bosea spartocytisi]
MHTACTNPTPSAIPSLSAAPSDPSATPPRAPIPAELMARIEQAVTGAGSAEFAVDPLLGPSLSAMNSFLASVVKRSGAVIEDALYAALVRHRRFLVMQQVRIPITRAAEMYVQENGAARVEELSLTSDGASVRTGHFDLIVIDQERSVAMVIEIKRGSGITESKKRRQTERDLACARLQLASYLRTLLGIKLKSYRCHVVDFYGRSGFREGLTVTRDGLDALFGVPVTPTIDAALGALESRMLARVPPMLQLAQERLADRANVATRPRRAGRGVLAALARSREALPEAAMSPAA